MCLIALPILKNVLKEDKNLRRIEIMENVTGAYDLYEFLKELVESGKLKENHDNSEVYFIDEDGFAHGITDYSFDDNQNLILW